MWRIAGVSVLVGALVAGALGLARSDAPRAGPLEVRQMQRTDVPSAAVEPEVAWAPPRPGTWRQLPAGPLSARGGHSMIWTGADVIVWGGADWNGRPLTDGAAFDPATGRWRLLPEGGPRDVVTRAVWTGVDMVTVSATETVRYDPRRERWRTAPTLPLPAGHTVTDRVVAAGDAVVVVTEPVTRDDAPAVFALDSGADGWRRLADPPVRLTVEHVVLADGDDVHILGPVDELRTASVILRLGDEAPTWTPTRSPPGLEGRDLRKLLGAAGDRIVLWGASADGQSNYAAVRDGSGWRLLDPGPLPATWAAESLWMDDRLLVWDRLANHGAILDPVGNRWTRVDRPPVPVRLPRPAVWTTSGLFVWGAHGAGGAMYTPS